jgi:putative transposase
MKKIRFIETQVVMILKCVDGGQKVDKIYRKHGINAATYCNRKSKCGGLEPSDIKRKTVLE